MEIESTMDFIQQNLLGLYGAIVGTIALILNFVKLRHALSGDKIKLQIGIENNYHEDVPPIRSSTKSKDGDWRDVQYRYAYRITIRNLGAVSAYIEDAAVVDSSGVVRKVMVRERHTPYYFEPIELAKVISLEPKAKTSLDVFTIDDEPMFDVKKYFVIDTTGQRWERNT
ncbi:hypothetical protein [Vibrio harveyi]|uniref:hypothetical protein n=1 Tax=Vibrio harveyi TaxID=669 RepID=UPI0023805B75|nr:hypothetical protein [Vibrio harveyi]